MDKLSAMDLLAAAAGQPTSRELTPKDLEILAKYKAMCRDLLFQAPCECKICLRQYRTKDEQECILWHYMGRVGDPASLAQSYANSIEIDREYLYHGIIRSGPALLKKWRKGDVMGKKEYLMKAQPDIYPFSQPLIEIASRAKMVEEARRQKNAYLLPYLNVEDLSMDSVNFIQLLHYRTIFPPQDWVHFDNAQLQPGWKQGGFGEKSAEGCITLHGDQYGTWKEFDRQAVHRGDAYGAIRGLMILEAQQILMSFLRKMLTTILGNADTSHPQESKAETLRSSLPSVAFPHYDLTSCSKWIHFIEAEHHRKHPWLSAASIYTQQPFSAPMRFDIDAMIEIAETQAMEAGDELWLLQTDLDYFHDLMRRHEREWLDSVPGVEELKVFSSKYKMDNIGYIMTVKVVIQARDWQWLLEECQAIKEIMKEPDTDTHDGGSLPVRYESAIGGLQYLLQEAQSWYQGSLSKLFLKSPSFHSIMEVTATGKDHRNSWALGFDFKNYSQLYQRDRLCWCLYNLTKDPKDLYTFERSVILQHLEKYLETKLGRQETERIDPEMYRCISDMAAVERMLSILELHRPNFEYLALHPFLQPRHAWQVHFWLLIKPSNLSCAKMDLGFVLESSAKFRMPTGRRDEQWLTQRDVAQQDLNDLWRKAREAYQMMLEASKVPQEFIEPQLAMMRQGTSLDNRAQLDLEKRQILGRLQAARQRTFAESIIPPKDSTSGSTQYHEHPASHIQEPAKSKTKTRPEDTSASADQRAKYAAFFAKFTVDEELKEAEKPPPILYTLERGSKQFQTISSMLPDRSKSIEEAGKTMDWLDFVSTMKTLGFAAEHRGGSAFTFKGAIRLPSDPKTLQKRSFTVHRPHPDTEMGPILLQSLGRRCNRRFGWQRENFAAEEKSVEQGI